MALRTQRWSLDTCDCVYDQQYDDADYAGTNVVTNHVRVCAAHQAIAFAPDRPTHAIIQNKRKNRVFARLQEAFESDLYDRAADGALTLRNGATVEWEFSGVGVDRVLTVTITGLGAVKKALAQAWCDNNLGAGRVVVV